MMKETPSLASHKNHAFPLRGFALLRFPFDPHLINVCTWIWIDYGQMGFVLKGLPFPTTFSSPPAPTIPFLATSSHGVHLALRGTTDTGSYITRTPVQPQPQTSTVFFQTWFYHLCLVCALLSHEPMILSSHNNATQVIIQILNKEKNTCVLIWLVNSIFNPCLLNIIKIFR